MEPLMSQNGGRTDLTKVRRDEWGCTYADDLEHIVMNNILSPEAVPAERRWFAWIGRCGFGFRLRWIEVQAYWYGWRGNR